MSSLIKEITKGNLHVKVYETRSSMGKAAAEAIAEKICELQDKQDLRIIFAAAPSQNEMLENLIAHSKIKWGKITAFHMDEYLGLDSSAPQLFSNFLKERIFNKVPFKAIHILESKNGEKEIQRYSDLLNEAPIDIVCLGIGENGHLAFNDPPVADFKDPETVKIVELDEVCRKQQVNDGCFSSLDLVPTRALTLTIPTLLKATYQFVVVPASTKAIAVKETLENPVSTACPSTILREQENCMLFVDKDSAKYIL